MKFIHIFTTQSFVARVKRKAKEEGWHPVRAARELAKEVMLGYAIYYGFALLLTIGILVILSFTDLLGGPFVLAQVVLFLLVGTVLLASAGIWWLWWQIKKRVKNIGNTFHHRSGSTHEGEVIDGHIAEKSDKDT